MMQIKSLSDKSLTEEEKNEAIEKIALENVDIKALGLYTLGNIRKDLDENTMIKNFFKNIKNFTFSKISLFKKFNIKNRKSPD